MIFIQNIFNVTLNMSLDLELIRRQRQIQLFTELKLNLITQRDEAVLVGFFSGTIFYVVYI